jgi:hypothetical protein
MIAQQTLNRIRQAGRIDQVRAQVRLLEKLHARGLLQTRSADLQPCR